MGGCTGQTTSNIPITFGQWNHIAFVYNGSFTDYYIDGSYVGTMNTAPCTFHNTNINTITIGGNTIGGTTTANSFNGTIDEVKIYPFALNANQIKSEFAKGAWRIGS